MLVPETLDPRTPKIVQLPDSRAVIVRCPDRHIVRQRDDGIPSALVDQVVCTLRRLWRVPKIIPRQDDAPRPEVFLGSRLGMGPCYFTTSIRLRCERTG
ncbi:hypothetical protein H7849_21320 [Alloacidobacterium dinghuense]|uniref:Uncharacterized protein n=1 Tax=Alloacidobacterium dinghuense TaxID=2763107 RepID=A0A7G8BGB3_9BACT|nr:hypothetical protein [Alloacidobacterium dinghuense]QNI31583.1 hypothetical protein H7849_21320 [Alloacidobacterium dinghuense]